MKFKFLVTEQYRQIVEIDADDRDAAIEAMEAMMDSGIDVSETGDRVSQDYQEI